MKLDSNYIIIFRLNCKPGSSVCHPHTSRFACFSLLAPRNPTVSSVLLLCASSVSGAGFLIMEMCPPETGLMRASCAPLRKAFTRLGQ